MAKFSDVLLASDFDRTLSGCDGTIPQANLDAIRYFMDEGGAFTVASGRSIPLFRQKAALVPVNAPCILSNGAILYDYNTKTQLDPYLARIDDMGNEVNIYSPMATNGHYQMTEADKT